MDVPRTQAPEHVPDDVLDLAVPSADVSLTPPLMGANAPARLSLTKLALHPANTEDAWNGGIRPHRPATEPATTPVSPDGPYGMEVRVVRGVVVVLECSAGATVAAVLSVLSSSGGRHLRYAYAQFSRVLFFQHQCSGTLIFYSRRE